MTVVLYAWSGFSLFFTLAMFAAAAEDALTPFLSVRNSFGTNPDTLTNPTQKSQ